MEVVDKKRAVSLGIRVGSVFLMAVVTVIIVAYYVLSQNFQSMMTDYTIKIVESMTNQGVKIIETELDMGRQEISFLADSFQVSESEGDAVIFPQIKIQDEYLRMVYVTEEGSIASDGRQRDIRERQDILAAYAGEIAIYGPYFNEEDEFVVCYSAPIKQGDNIVGVLSIERDGYEFCELIEGIRFVDSGECYIINAEGTDIAVSDSNHIDWVNSQYNAKKILAEKPDEETETIMKLEQKGLDGESGIGTYYWKGGLCYLAYKPIPSVGWVILAGLREEEIVAMTRTSIFASISNSYVLPTCLFLVCCLTILIVFWIISSMKKHAEINERLKVIANYDALTGLMNRNSYHEAVQTLIKENNSTLACVYVDVNGLHELNNHLGHQAGDEMLKAVADELLHAFSKDMIYRIGGDEFVVLCRGKLENDIRSAIEQARQALSKQSYEISVGMALQKDHEDVENVIDAAESAMQQDKQTYYRKNGNGRRIRDLNVQVEQMLLEKKDADTFLEVIAPKFKGVYFVDLSKDTVRHLYIPSYFEVCLQESENRFSKALLLYARKIVKPKYYDCFERLCDFVELEKRLSNGEMPEFVFQKIDGDWLRLQILTFNYHTDVQQETLWIFAKADFPKE